MRTVKIYFGLIILILSCTSCLEDISEQVELSACTQIPNNENHPFKQLYREILDEYVAKGFPGLSIAIETPDNGWFIGSAGYSCIERNLEMTACQLQHAGFVSNIYTATMITLLVEEEKINLDDRISKYLPEDIVNNIANADEATIQQVLEGTSGIVNYDDNLKMYLDGFNDPDVFTSTEYLLEEYAYGQPAYGPPGEERYRITRETDYCLLGMIIEKVSGMSLKAYFEQEICEPIGLVNTFFNPVVGSKADEKTVNSYWEQFPGEIQNCTDLQKTFTRIAMGDQGVVSTPYEYARFIQELMWGNIVDSASLDLMLPKISSLGMGVFEYQMDVGLAYGNNNSSVGSMMGMQYFPEEDITVVMTTNIGDVFSSKTTDLFDHELLLDILAVTFLGTRN